MAAERPAKLQKLHALRHSLPHMSKRALEAVLKDVKDNGVPEFCDHRHMVEAQRLELQQHNVFGPLLESTMMTRMDRVNQQPVLCVNSLSYLHAVVTQGGSMMQLVLDKLATFHNDYDHPWNLILYSDEVCPGNPLAARTERKAWMLYLSFLEFGHALLSKSQAWLTVGCIRSNVVADLSATISQVVSKVLERIFCSDNADPVEAGLPIKLPSGDHIRLYFQFGLFLQDGGAHKLVYCIKADSGSRFCLLCGNMFLQYSKDADGRNDNDEDEDEVEDGLICSACTYSELRLSTDSEVLASVDRLAARAATCTKAELKMWEQASGINHEPHGLLLNKKLRDKNILAPISQYLHDTMHALVSSGCLNTTIYLMLAAAVGAGLPIYTMLEEYLSNWVMPGATTRSHLSKLFTAKKAEAYKTPGLLIP